MNLNQYIESINKRYQSGMAKEHSYRGDLEMLIREIVPGIDITNEPANVTDCGNPDLVITKGIIPIGFIEAKDLGKDLNNKQYKEQFNRYCKALDNLIITDYIWFKFYQYGELTHEIRIAYIEGKNVIAMPENFTLFTNLIQNFCTFITQTIKSSKKLAEMMAAKARLLQNILEYAVTSDEESQENTSLKDQYESFRRILIHDLSPKAFADIYAQTLAYGMFAARLHDPSLETFSRQEAAELIPKSNPFLRKLFQYVAGYDIDERIKTTVDNLAEVFRATNVEELLKNFGKSTQTHDPIIHFYETFLAEYDPALRKARGVWYTPEPVVKFIVRAVDDILKSEFGLKDGLADTSKTTIKIKTDKPDKRTKSGYVELDKEVHQVQVLDPATGTGTFLAEVVKYIYNSKFKAMQGAWSGYVEEHLIPRLNGFELLMASYSMAHLKLDMLLTETGFKAKKEQRLNIFLTNSLEEHHPDTGTLFSSWLSTEANEANNIKRDTPVMVVIGNPPYSVSSSNKGEWIQNLLQDYKKNLNEKKINLDDDYIKFIRYGQHIIEKNGEGILAYISNNSFIDGITHRQMRKDLLDAFDSIYILNLHGDTKKNESEIHGSKDENVFDIMQGVSINIFIKNRKNNKPELKLNVFDLYGLRQEKYTFLNQKIINEINWINPNIDTKYYFFSNLDLKAKATYEKGFKLSDIFYKYGTGIETKCDDISIQFTKDEAKSIYNDFINSDPHSLEMKFSRKNSPGWSYQNAKKDLENNSPEILPVTYRPFDTRFTCYTGFSSGFMGRPRSETMNDLKQGNIALISARGKRNYAHTYFISNKITDKSISSSLDNSYVFPLYTKQPSTLNSLYNEPVENLCNIKPEFISKFKQLISYNEITNNHLPLSIIDYIYSFLYNHSYREKFKEFLKIDFPYIPYPKDKETFFALAQLGEELRKIHLLESDTIEHYVTTYPHDGDNTITRKIVSKDWELYDKKNQLGRIWINDQQCFDQIPLRAWEFYIGGYQPAQKWLKDRTGRKLSFDEILHYQKIVVALMETDRIMQEIDQIDFE